MITISGADKIRGHIRRWRSAGEGIAFVPTMGNLHDGHLALIHQAKRLCPRVVVSIFVNPLQFGPTEDFASYPRTLQDDAMVLADEQVDILFTPDDSLIKTPKNSQHSQVVVPDLSTRYCGEFRPQFFAGVTTIVTKLFNIVTPDVAIFGEKDYQQLLCIRRMVQDLHFAIKIQSVPTVRESDGLALSSRNQYLNTEERAKAGAIYSLLKFTKYKLQSGQTDYASLEEDAIEKLITDGFKPDYFTICDANTLRKAQYDTQDFVILTAAYLGNARLIDNITFKVT